MSRAMTMTREQRRARRDMMNPRRHLKPVKAVRSKRCRCGSGTCKKHGRFDPLEKGA